METTNHTGIGMEPDSVASARKRMRNWWAGESLGRPAILIMSRNPAIGVAPSPPPGCGCRFTLRDLDYRVSQAIHQCRSQMYFAEAIPHVQPNLGPCSLALYLGCGWIEQPDTIWHEPCIDDLATHEFVVSDDNYPWKFTRDFIERLHQEAGALVAFPDFTEGLDILAAMRGTETIMLDMIEQPEAVTAALTAITQAFLFCYDALYPRLREEDGSSLYRIWAPGRMCRLQCDSSAMISPELFDTFVVPVIRSMLERVDYSFYHLDGPAATRHLDLLLALDGLPMIQWVPGAGAAGVADQSWWPMYHRILDAGKTVFLPNFPANAPVEAFQREFGEGWSRFLIETRVNEVKEAPTFIERCSLA